MRYEVVSVHDLEHPHGTCSAEENEDGYSCSHKCLAEGLQHLCGCTDFTKGTKQYSTVKYKVVKVLLGGAFGMLEQDGKREREREYEGARATFYHPHCLRVQII